jgi:hypothetical protein
MESTDDSSSSLAALEQGRANFRHLVFDIAWFGIAIPATSRFLSVYAIRLDASAMLLGWLAALPAIVALTTSSLAMWWRKKYPDTVHALFWPGLGYRLAFLLPALTPFFPAAWQPAWLIVAVALPAVPQGIASVLFLVTLREGIDSRDLTALMSRRSLVFNTTVAASTLALGVWLSKAPFPANYQIMYMAAFVMALMSLLHVAQIKPLVTHPVILTDRPAIRPWRSPAFRQMAITTVIAHIAFFSILPIIPLRLVNEMGADEEFMSIYALAELTAAALMAAFTNQIVRRLGTRPTIAAGLFGTGLAGLVLATTPNLYVTLPASALSGGMWTMAAISLFGFFSESTPPEDATRYSTVYNQIVMLSVFAGPMLGSQLASTPLSLTAVLLIGSGLRLLASVVIPFDFSGRARRRPLSPA